MNVKVKPAHFTRKHQRKARAAVSPESCAANGRKGAAATAAKYGYEQIFLGARRKRLANPSRWELLVIGLLARCGAEYVREYRLGTTHMTADFYFPATGRAIEVRGEIHFKASAPNQEARQANWLRKTQWLHENGMPLLVLDYHELADDRLAATAQRIQEFLL